MEWVVPVILAVVAIALVMALSADIGVGHAWQRWRQSRAHTFLGSKVYRTTWLVNKEPDGTSTDVICSFMIDGNGRRFCKLEHPKSSNGRRAADEHDTLRLHRHRWEQFGTLPDDINRPGSTPTGKIIAFPGGKDDGAA